MADLFTEENLKQYDHFMRTEEKSRATIEKYLRDVKKLRDFIETDNELSKTLMIKFKESLKETYKVTSINSILAAVNHFMKWTGYPELALKSLKCQKRMFYSGEQELSAAEYRQLISAAGTKKDEQMRLIMQTIGATGIRVSELAAITVKALREGKAVISCKSKTRTILLPGRLCRLLLGYVRSQNIKQGPVFLSRNNRPLHRSSIWKRMKAIAGQTRIDSGKVFPHNLRHLFARTFYCKQKDIVSLADILGHSNIETTRIYTMKTEREHVRQIECLGLLIS